ncbi:MAG: hypothetical protein JWQ38_793 [Flavipsychrobacter sp.]|nr:hypothetical protein [Flavipsychrobacter sp.]
MKKTLTILSLLLLTAGATSLLHSCKKKSDSNTNNVSTDAVALSIQTGARTIEPGSTMTYTAVLVDSKGNTSAATGVTWSVSNSLGTFAGGVFTPGGTGSGTVTGTVTVNGKTLTAQAPIGIYLPAVFAVVPSAIVWSTNAGTIPLESVYLGTGTVSGYTYSSNNASIASVDGSGNVSFNATGECIITVTANGITGNNKVYVPVLVVGMPTVTLPVVRVKVNPAGAEIFRGETVSFSAKAYNSSNSEVNSTFTWVSQDPSVATIDATGKVTAVNLGKTIITATTNGITGQAEVDVLPDTAIMVTPIVASISPNGTKQFTAQAYAVNHSTKALNAITMPAGLKWEVPTTGVPVFDIASVSTTGLVTMNSSATVGLATVVIATVSSHTIAEGSALIMVSDCNCGTTTAGVTHIKVTSGTSLNISAIGGPVTVTAQALDATETPVPGATISLCSDSPAVCTVDASSGTIIPVGPGTATVTVCNGGVQTTISVTVTL